jgi:Asp-tRNA(Asn)/Glu-tRNA(Gln) amidotransferase A subunit family amidase
MSGTHFNFDQTIPDDLGLDPRLNTYAAERGEPTVHMRFGVLELTFTDADQAQQIADAFAEAARLLCEAGATIGAEDGAR